MRTQRIGPSRSSSGPDLAWHVRGAALAKGGHREQEGRTEGYRAAAVARVSDQIWSVGIDAEPHQPLPEGVLDLVSLPSERAQCQALAPLVHWDRLLFCAKEAVYKAWFPLAGRWLGFEQCQIHLTRNTITAQLLIRGPIVRGTALQELQGNWLVADGLILAAVIVR